MQRESIPYWDEPRIQAEFARRGKSAIARWCYLLLALIGGVTLLHSLGAPHSWCVAAVVAAKLAMICSYAALTCPSCGRSQYKNRSGRCRNCGVQLVRKQPASGSLRRDLPR